MPANSPSRRQRSRRRWRLPVVRVPGPVSKFSTQTPYAGCGQSAWPPWPNTPPDLRLQKVKPDEADDFIETPRPAISRRQMVPHEVVRMGIFRFQRPPRRRCYGITWRIKRFFDELPPLTVVFRLGKPINRNVVEKYVGHISKSQSVTDCQANALNDERPVAGRSGFSILRKQS